MAGRILSSASIRRSSTPDHPSTREYVEQNNDSDTKLYLAPPLDYSSDISIEVTKEFVRILDGHDLKAVIIENPRVVHALKQIFALARSNYES